MERMLRFLKFVQAILDNLLNNREDKFRTCIKNAYDKELGPYHNFFLRGIVKGILFLAPDRETFMNGITESVGHIEDEEKNYSIKIIVCNDEGTMGKLCYSHQAFAPVLERKRSYWTCLDILQKGFTI